MNEYQETFTSEELAYIAKEFSRLKGKTYLDHAGASLYQEGQMKSVVADLNENLYLNPHTSKYTTDCIDQVRFDVLRWFNASSGEYTVIFTSGATAAIKIVAETFDYGSRGCLAYLHDNHTSVLGMRDIAQGKNAAIKGISRDELFDIMSTADDSSDNEYDDAHETLKRGLFVYPAQCNFNGTKYPLNWIKRIKNGILDGYTGEQTEWGVLLDAAAFVSTNRLDLSRVKPDFTCVSFYKIFGYPTGLGALIVRNESVHMLGNKSYYGGGTVEISMSRRNHHVKREIIHERFEDGTIPFLSILAVKHGFNGLNKITRRNINIVDAISDHTFNLARNLYNRLVDLRHGNGNKLVKLYTDTPYDNRDTQGGIVNFNLLRSNGEFIGYAEVIHMAELFNILLRSGCFCNPGACQRHLNLTDDQLLKHHKAGHKCGDNNDLIDGVPTGSIRASFGYMSTLKDVDTLINMIVRCFEDKSNVETEQYTTITNDFNFPKITCRHINGSINLTDFKLSGRLKSIRIYPIKSCGAFKMNSWEIGPNGFKYDREWMIVSENGVALTQKQDTRMCLIRPSIDLVKQRLILSFPGVDDINLPLNGGNTTSTADLCSSKVCGDRIQGFDCGDEVSDWLRDVLGLPDVRLLRQQSERIKSNNKTTVSLSNQAQYLMINLTSIKWLSTKIESREFDDCMENLVDRFRGNLIVETDREFDEFKWRRAGIGANVFGIDGPCTRCQMVCIDQETGEKTTEPLRTISKEFKGKLHFGIYLTHMCSVTNSTVLSCGDVLLSSLT